MIVLGEKHLRRILRSYFEYYPGVAQSFVAGQGCSIHPRRATAGAWGRGGDSAGWWPASSLRTSRCINGNAVERGVSPAFPSAAACAAEARFAECEAFVRLTTPLNRKPGPGERTTYRPQVMFRANRIINTILAKDTH